MTLLRATADTQLGISTFWDSNCSRDESYLTLSEGSYTIATSPIGSSTFSFDCSCYSYTPTRTLKITDSESNIQVCAQIRHVEYSGYDFGIIERFACAASDFYRFMAELLLLRVIKYAKLNNFHAIIAYSRAADYYTNFDFTLIKPVSGMSLMTLRPMLLSTQDIINAAESLGGPAATTTTSTCTSTSSTASTLSTTSSTLTTASTLSTLSSTMSTASTMSTLSTTSSSASTLSTLSTTSSSTTSSESTMTTRSTQSTTSSTTTTQTRGLGPQP